MQGATHQVKGSRHAAQRVTGELTFYTGQWFLLCQQPLVLSLQDLLLCNVCMQELVAAALGTTTEQM